MTWLAVVVLAWAVVAVLIAWGWARFHRGLR